ncbi:DgyrCDS2321 [Dimorphilus gyrociliatus]|uniref:DgyrCDS2321 n=1 Tax=Dimorphilus gyrociliatus TaxID=2664684 RepID=A0A7I8VF25_9ANNE|nr:DgyrCDS2321 [Dimorphilus gyrociliatus]
MEVKSECIGTTYGNNEFDQTALSLILLDGESTNNPNNNLQGVYEGKEYTLKGKALLPETKAANYKLQLIVPSTETVRRINCESFIVGSSSDICGAEYPLINYTYFKSITNNTGSNIEKYSNTYTNLVKEAIDVLTIDYGCINVTSDGTQDSKDEIVFNIKFIVNAGLQSSNLTFYLRLFVGNKWIKTVGTLLSISPLGPNLRSTLSLLNYAPVQSGNILRYRGLIYHLQGTTEDAVNLRISASSINVGGVVLTNTIRYKLPNGEFVNKTSLNPIISGITLAKTFFLSNPIIIEFQVEVNDNLLLGDKSFFHASLSSDYRNNKGIQFYRADSTSTPLMPLLLDSTLPSDVDLPSVYPLGLTHTIVKKFKIPRGSLNNFKFTASFSTSSYPDTPVKFINSSLDLPSYINTTNAKPLVVDGTGFTESKIFNRRRKRALTVTKEFTRDMGSFVNPSTSPATPAEAEFRATFVAAQNVLPGGTISGNALFSYNSNSAPLASRSGLVVQPSLQIVNKTIEVIDTQTFPNTIRVNLTVEHTSTSTGDAQFIELRDGHSSLIVFSDRFIVNPTGALEQSSGVVTAFILSIENLPLGNQLELSFKAQPKNEGKDLANGITRINSTIYYNSTGGNNAYRYGALQASTCIEKVNIETSDLFTDHAVTVVMLLVGLIVGALLIILALFIYKKCRNTLPGGLIRPESAVDRILLHENERNFENLKNDHLLSNIFSKAKGLASSVLGQGVNFFLCIKDSLSMNNCEQEYEIAEARVLEVQIEEERNKAAIDSTKSMLYSLQKNKDISPKIQQQYMQKFERNVRNFNNNMFKEYEMDVIKVVKPIAVENRAQEQLLIDKHKREENAMEEKWQNLPEEDRRELRNLMIERHKKEILELQFKLNLDIDVAVERIRKENVLRARIALKEQQQNLFQDLKQDNHISNEQLEWILGKHRENQLELDRTFDEQLSKQKFILEEKLNRRKMLLQLAENRDVEDAEVLSKIRKQEIQIVKESRKILSPDTAREMIKEINEDSKKIKSKVENERDRLEGNLQQKLSDRRRKRLEELRKKQDMEIKELEKSQEKELIDASIDPVELVKVRQNMITSHKAEIAHLEWEIDQEEAIEFGKLRENLMNDARKEFEDRKLRTSANVVDQGFDKEDAERLLRRHQEELRKFSELKESERDQQKLKLKEKLEKRRLERGRERQQELQTEEDIRQYEEQVVRKLCDGQIALSADERQKIIQEHEKQMVNIENNIALSKLQQQQALQEKIANRRRREKNNLQKKQKQEEAKFQANADDDDDDYDSRQVDLMKKQAEEQLELLRRGSALEADEVQNELDAIHESMIRERSTILKEQEERLASMLADMQFKKAREMAKMEEQQKAINTLKANIMDDLSEKGVLGDPKCREVIENYQRDQQKINDVLDEQRQKQEKVSFQYF